MRTKFNGRFLMGLAVASAAAACGNDDGSSPFDSGTEGAETGTPSSAEGSGPTGGTSGNGTSGADSGSLDDGSDDGVKLDVGVPPGGYGCDCGLTALWIADHDNDNLGQIHNPNSVLKINTQTLQVEARYLTRPDGMGNPSRTSVNLAGDVVVGNRHGGLTKFYGHMEDCVESNGMPGIQTSTDDQALPWDQEECRAWHVDMGKTNQRPVAWTGGTLAGCDATGAKVWSVTTMTNGLFPGAGGMGATAYLVDGDTGAIDGQVDIPDFNAGGFAGLGPYGGAVDADGNLYFSPNTLGLAGMKLARVDRDTLDVTLWDLPVNSYGITVDHKGRVWFANTLGSIGARFDPVSEAWDVIEGFGGGSGLSEGPDGWMYLSVGNSVHAYDVETMAPGGTWTNDQTVKGVSFDADGFLWAVTYRGTDNEDVPTEDEAFAYKIDVANMSTAGVVTGLRDPYTYSDMTGNVLNTVACDPEG
jgi:hypothetical protein